MEIFICEDSEKIRNHWIRGINTYLAANPLDMKIAIATENPIAILDYLKVNQPRGIYFLDVELNDDFNGIDLAQKIRQIDPNGFIVFITSHPQYSQLTFKYKLEVLDYIQKTPNLAEVIEHMCNCLTIAHTRKSQEQKNAGEQMMVNSGNKELIINHQDVAYFSYNPNVRMVIAHLLNRRKIEFNSKLEEIEKISSQFFRCDKSYIVNLQKIEFIDKKNFELNLFGGQKCKISVRKLRELLKKYAHLKTQ